MNKRGIVLIFSLLVVLTLSVFLGGFYFKVISENQLAKRSVDSMRAFWLAEAGIAQVKANSGVNNASGYLLDSNHTYDAQVTHLSGNYYSVSSTGQVIRADGSVVTRTLTATIKTIPPDASKFKYGIETTVYLDKGSGSHLATINPADSWKDHSVLNFTDLFGGTIADIEDLAKLDNHVYTPSTLPSSVSGLTWVNGFLTMATSFSGSGVLIINGGAHFSGQVNFTGVIYVIGELKISGQATITGSILAESNADIINETDLTKNVTINYSPPDIANALQAVTTSKQIVSWKES